MKFLHDVRIAHNGQIIDNGYWEIMDENYQIGETVRVENYAGGYHFHTISSNDEIIEASDWQPLMRKYYIKNQNSPYGWIDLEGNFYGCNYYEHALCLEACFGITEYEAEKRGFIKVFDDGGWSSYNDFSYYHEGFLTDAQRKTLIDRGLTLNDEDIE